MLKMHELSYIGVYKTITIRIAMKQCMRSPSSVAFWLRNGYTGDPDSHLERPLDMCDPEPLIASDLTVGDDVDGVVLSTLSLTNAAVIPICSPTPLSSASLNDTTFTSSSAQVSNSGIDQRVPSYRSHAENLSYVARSSLPVSKPQVSPVNVLKHRVGYQWTGPIEDLEAHLAGNCGLPNIRPFLESTQGLGKVCRHCRAYMGPAAKMEVHTAVCTKVVASPFAYEDRLQQAPPEQQAVAMNCSIIAPTTEPVPAYPASGRSFLTGKRYANKSFRAAVHIFIVTLQISNVVDLISSGREKHSHNVGTDGSTIQLRIGFMASGSISAYLVKVLDESIDRGPLLVGESSLVLQHPTNPLNNVALMFPHVPEDAMDFWSLGWSEFVTDIRPFILSDGSIKFYLQIDSTVAWSPKH